jgi:hypothetical protein
MDKRRAQTTDARAFLAEWQKRYKITLHDISEDMLQAMEEYAGQRREQAAHPEIEQILSRVANHEITPAKAMELLQNWSDCAAGTPGDVSSEQKTVTSKEMHTYPIPGWE